MLHNAECEDNCDFIILYNNIFSYIGYMASNRRIIVFLTSFNVLFTTASRTALEPTQSPIQWVPEALSLGVKRPEREADHSPPSSAAVKECVELYLHSPIGLHDLVLS
jgi:hypothetical protein